VEGIGGLLEGGVCFLEGHPCAVEEPVLLHARDVTVSILVVSARAQKFFEVVDVCPKFMDLGLELLEQMLGRKKLRTRGGV
jgi:hypothetical protein